MKKTLTVVALAVFVVAFALPINSLASVEADALEELRLIDLQTAAVSTDMALYLGWMSEEKDEMKKAADQAKIDVNKIKGQLDQLPLSGELKSLRVKDVEVIDKLLVVYGGVEKKSPEAIDAEFAQFNALYSGYQKQLAAALEKYCPKIQARQEFDASSETGRLISDLKDKQVFFHASQLVREKQYDKAYEYFKTLAQKYKDTPVKIALSVPLSDCLFMMDSQEATAQDGMELPDQGIKFLLDAMDQNEYSPVLYDIFFTWRSNYQGLYNGMSNSSEIPNAKYNEKRYQVYRTLKKYSREHPDDKRAKEQIALLINLPNIERGGAFGNSALVDFGMSHSEEIKDLVKKQKQG